MAKIVGRAQLTVVATFELNEAELRALDALVGYGDDAFIKVFYEKLGKAYMREHEGGLRSFFCSCREQLPGVLGRVSDARSVFDGRMVARDREQ